MKVPIALLQKAKADNDEQAGLAGRAQGSGMDIAILEILGELRSG